MEKVVVINLANRNLIIRVIIVFFITIFLIGANLEVFHYAEGSGPYFGEFALKRGLLLFGFVITSLVILLGTIFTSWNRERVEPIAQVLMDLRERIHWFRWFLAIFIIFLPIVVFQYTRIGNDLSGYYFRLVALSVTGLSLAFVITTEKNKIITSSSLAVSLLIISCTFTFFSVFKNVVDYPFSIGWSEGNRIWNYSILFGRERYVFPADQPIFAFVDSGRQSLWGLPFLFPNVSIIHVRLWDAIVITLPYAVFGWIAFRRTSKNRLLWLLSGLWTFVFLSQGPIYTPLVLSAILVAIAWRSPLWIALPLIVVASFYAQLTRFTWMFAPAMWIGMLYLGDRIPRGKNITRYYWAPAIAAILAGLIGGDIIPRLLERLSLNSALVAEEYVVGNGIELSTIKPISVDFILEVLSRQSLIWSRLLPNPTFRPGILLALVLVTLPLIIFLIYLVRSKKWSLVMIQKVAILITITAFLLVGLIISTKIGGGADLHNMDMFLVGLVFVAALAWKGGADRVLSNLDKEPRWVQYLIILLVAFYAIGAVNGAKPLTLPPNDVVEKKIDRIRYEVTQAVKEGDVLLIDQRQLLTFGNIGNIPLVTEYEKVYLMNQAFNENGNYFEGFYEDIENQRFALIISEPLRVVYRGSDYHFGDENDAWVRWVSEPVLCFYKPIATFKDFQTQLLIPRTDTVECP